MTQAPLRRIELQCIVWALFAFGVGGTLARDTLLLHFMESSNGQWNSVLPFLYCEHVSMWAWSGWAGLQAANSLAIPSLTTSASSLPAHPFQDIHGERCASGSDGAALHLELSSQ